MKKYILILSIIFPLLTNAQSNLENDKLSTFLKIYNKEIDTHLKDIVKRELGETKDENSMHWRYVALKTTTLQVEEKVREQLKKNKQDQSSMNNDILVRLIDFNYQNTFTGLPISFFKTVHEKINLL
jgi:hypothetical protein